MPNSKLIDKGYKLPEKVFNNIKSSIRANHVDDKHTRGYKRANDLINGERITYQQMKRLKNYFDTYEGDGSDLEFKLVGGNTTKKWVDDALKNDRTVIKNVKKSMKDAGMENQFIKTHEKDRDNANPEKSNSGMIDPGKSSQLKNIMSGDAIYKENYQKEITQIKYLIEYLNKT